MKTLLIRNRYLNDVPVIAGILLLVCGSLITAFTPFMLGGYVEFLKFSVAQASDAVASMTGGIMVGTLLVFFKGNIWNRKTIALFAIGLMIVGNINATIFHRYESLLPILFLTGIGNGTLMSLGATIIAGSNDSARYLGLHMFISTSIAACLLLLLPIAIDNYGLNSIFYILLSFSVAGLFFLRFIESYGLPARETSIVNNGSNSRVNYFQSFLCVLATFIIFCGFGGFWPYIERMSAASGVGHSVLSVGLSLGMLGGAFIGCMAAMIGGRYGLFLPVFSACLVMLFGSYALVFHISEIVVAFLLPLFHMSFILMIIYNNAALAALDIRGRILVIGLLLETLGGFVGPLLAGQMLRLGVELSYLGKLFMYSVLLYLLVRVIAKADLRKNIKT